MDEEVTGVGWPLMLLALALLALVVGVLVMILGSTVCWGECI